MRAQVVYPNLAAKLKHDTCINKKFSIVFWLIQDSSNRFSVPVNFNAVVNNSITPFMNNLNNVFSRICVSFENCAVKVIPNYNYNSWTQPGTDTSVTRVWFMEDVINFYLPASVTPTMAAERDGYTYPPSTGTMLPRNTIVAPLGSLEYKNTANFKSSGPMHVIGHFFGLSNTFAELGTPATPPPPPGVTSHEYVDRTNCSTNGDKICDTEADPYPARFSELNGPCFFGASQGIKDSKNVFYTPPVNNFMSNYDCRCKFTQEQYNFMAYYILANRLYLH